LKASLCEASRDRPLRKPYCTIVLCRRRGRVERSEPGPQYPVSGSGMLPEHHRHRLEACATVVGPRPARQNGLVARLENLAYAVMRCRAAPVELIVLSCANQRKIGYAFRASLESFAARSLPRQAPSKAFLYDCVMPSEGPGRAERGRPAIPSQWLRHAAGTSPTQAGSLCHCSRAEAGPHRAWELRNTLAPNNASEYYRPAVTVAGTYSKQRLLVQPHAVDNQWR